jgi:protein-tyrosine phosphatase
MLFGPILTNYLNNWNKMKPFKKILFSLMLFTYHTMVSSQNSFDLFAFPQKNKSTVYLSPLPGRVDMEQDLKRITEKKITTVIMLVSNEELAHYGVPNLKSKFDSLHIRIYQSPIADYGLPSPIQTREILNQLHKSVKSNENVLIHCVGGYGRSGTIMGCYSRQYLKKSENEVIDYVRSIRGASAIETPEQVQFVREWKK